MCREFHRWGGQSRYDPGSSSDSQIARGQPHKESGQGKEDIRRKPKMRRQRSKHKSFQGNLRNIQRSSVSGIARKGLGNKREARRDH